MSTKSKFRGPDSILGTDPVNGFCVGQAKSKYRRCTKPVNSHNLSAARALIDEMDEEENLVDVKTHLQKLASLTLCREWHNSSRADRKSYNQIDETARKWKKLVDEAEKRRLQKAEKRAEADKKRRTQKTPIASSSQGRDPGVQRKESNTKPTLEEILERLEKKFPVQHEEPETKPTLEELLERLEKKFPVQREEPVPTLEELINRMEKSVKRMNESMRSRGYESEDTEDNEDETEETANIILTELQNNEKRCEETVPMTPSEPDLAYITPPSSPRTIHFQTIVDQHPIEHPAHAIATPESKSKVDYPNPSNPGKLVNMDLPTPSGTPSDKWQKMPMVESPPSPSPAPKSSAQDPTSHEIMEDKATDEEIRKQFTFPCVPQRINFTHLESAGIAVQEQKSNRIKSSLLSAEYDQQDAMSAGDFNPFPPHIPQNISLPGNRDNSEVKQSYSFSKMFGIPYSSNPAERKEEEEEQQEEEEEEEEYKQNNEQPPLSPAPSLPDIIEPHIQPETPPIKIEENTTPEQQSEGILPEPPITPLNKPESFGHAVITPTSIKYKTYLPSKQIHGLITPPETPETAHVNPPDEYTSSPESSIYFNTPRRQLKYNDVTPASIARKPLLRPPVEEEIAAATIELHIPALYVSEVSEKNKDVEDQLASRGPAEDSMSLTASCLRRFGLRRLRESIKAKAVTLKIKKEERGFMTSSV
ncbi:hypothetical protein B7463_g1198, partial [Scytalidium lignicola]